MWTIHSPKDCKYVPNKGKDENVSENSQEQDDKDKIILAKAYNAVIESDEE
jgi:hypothetical protein